MALHGKNPAHDHDPMAAMDDHGHTHGVIDPSLFSTARGIHAVKVSLLVLMATALVQAVVVYFTGSVALLADTIHNFGDALTAIPLWVAFRIGTRAPSRRYTYGYGRLEDLAGLFIVILILASAVIAGIESVRRLYDPQPVAYLWAIGLAALIGFIGNELVARYRIKVGREIGSVALVADGQHARVDGLTSLAVLMGAAGVGLGFPLTDPLVGLGISLVILKIVWDSGREVFARMLDGVDPAVVSEIEYVAAHVNGVKTVNGVAVRWLGHRMRAELSIGVNPTLSVVDGHDIAAQVHHDLLHHLPYLYSAVIHIDPADLAADHHQVTVHVHDDLAPHSHLVDKQ